MTELLLTDFDLHLLAEGTHYRTYEKLGAHLREVNGVAGVHFAVWAPNASRVSVVGDFNGWDPATHPLTRRQEAGVWETFVPGVPKCGVLVELNASARNWSCQRSVMRNWRKTPRSRLKTPGPRSELKPAVPNRASVMGR